MKSSQVTFQASNPDVDFEERIVSTADHEAGHLILGAALGADIRFATVVPDGVFRGSCAWERPRVECDGDLGADWAQMVIEVAGCAAEYRFLDPSDDRIWLDDVFDDGMQDTDAWLRDVEEAARFAVRDAHRSRQAGIAIGPQDLERAAERALRAAGDDPAIATRILLRAATRATTEVRLRWETVSSLADALMSRRTLDGDQIWAIIEDATGCLPRLRRPTPSDTE